MDDTIISLHHFRKKGLADHAGRGSKEDIQAPLELEI